MSRNSAFLNDTIADYIRDVTLREPELARRLREETAAMEQANMQISPEQGQFMHLLAGLTNARRCIEVGVFTGYSSLLTAMALPEDGQLVACDVSEEWTAIARRYWAEAGVDARIDLRQAPALDTHNSLIAEGWQGHFDMAFIDADKEHYDGYYEACLELLRPRGLIVLDNMLWSGRVANEQERDADTRALRALNEKLHGDRRVEITLLPLADGISLAMKR